MAQRETGRRKAGRSLRDRYPVFFAFEGEPPRFLTHAESIAATPQERIRSVWPFLVKTVMRFVETLRPRERANFDPEDVLTELFCKLMEKDDKWEPARGRYITFAARVVGNEFHRVRDRSRTVKSPGNSYCRLREYEAEEEADCISEQRAATLEAMRRVLSDSESLDEAGAGPEAAASPVADAQSREERAIFADAVVQGYMSLDAEEAFAISHAYGLWTLPERAIGPLAQASETTHGTIKAAQARARQKIRKRLVALGHPAARMISTHDDEAA